MSSYQELSSAQIVLCDPDTIRQVGREARTLGLRRRRRPWPPPHRVAPSRAARIAAVLALPAIAFVVAVTLVTVRPASAPATITATPLGAAAKVTARPSAAASPLGHEHILDSSPRGAAVYRRGVLIGRTPILYEMTADDPLGPIDVRLDGYRTEHRYVDRGSPRLLVVPLRARQGR